MNRVLWLVQGLLAVVFLMSGVTKLITPPEVMAAQMALPLPTWFVSFIGVCEVLGALGLVLPGLLRIRPELTPLAAAGLTVLMTGAVVTTLLGGLGLAMAILPLVVLVLVAVVAFGRARLAPLPEARGGRRMRLAN